MKAWEDRCFQGGRAKLLSLQFLSYSLVSSTGCLRKEMAYSFFIRKRRARKHAKRGGATSGRKEEEQDTPIVKLSCLLLLYLLFIHCTDPRPAILLLHLPLIYFLSSIKNFFLISGIFRIFILCIYLAVPSLSCGT